MLDPAATNPDLYKVDFENDRVRLLEYIDRPGDRTAPHEHPDSVMCMLSTFRGRLYSANGENRGRRDPSGNDRVATGTASCGTQHR